LADPKADQSFHLELVLKVHLPKEVRQVVDSLLRPRPDQRLDVNARC